MGTSDLAKRLSTMSSEKRMYALRTLPQHLVDADQLERLHKLLIDLEFIDAKCAAGMVYDLQADYALALDILPEAQEEKEEGRAPEQEVAQYIREMIAYSQAWTNIRARHVEDPRNNPMSKITDIPLPVLASIRPWTDDQVQADTERVVNNPTRLDLIRAFSNFVTSESHNLVIFGMQPGFCLQQAHNYADSGPVVDAAEQIIRSQMEQHLILQISNHRSTFNFHPALVRTLETELWLEGVSLAADGKIVVTSTKGGWKGKDDHTPRVWNVATGQLLHKLKGHTDKVNSVSLTLDGKIAVSGSADKTLRVWDLATGRCLRALEGHTDRVLSVDLTPDGSTAVSGGSDGTLRVWDVGTGKCLLLIKEPREPVDAIFNPIANAVSVSITPDGKVAVSANQDHALRIWELASGECLHTLIGHVSWVNSVRIASAANIVVSASEDRTLRVWDLRTGQCIRTLEGHKYGVNDISITPDGNIGVSGSADKTLRVWDLQTGQCIRTLEGHTDYVFRVSVTPDGTTAVSSGRDETLRVWNLTTGTTGQSTRFLLEDEEHEDSVQSIRLSPNGKVAVSASHDETVRVWSVGTGICFRTLKGHTGPVLSVAMMPYEPMVVSGGADRTLRIWNVNTSQCLREFDGDTAKARVAPLGFHVGVDPSQKSFVDHTVGINAVSVTLDGRTIVSGSADGIVRVWDIETGQYSHTIEGHLGMTLGGNPGQGVQSIALTPDGRIAVSGGKDSTIRVWSLKTGKCLRTIEEPREPVDAELRDVSVNVTPDGRTAVSASASGGSMRVWDLATGKDVCTLDGHTGWVTAISIAADGKIVISGSVDHTLRVWDMATGQCLAIYNAPSFVRSLSEIRIEKQIAFGLNHGPVVFLSLHGFKFGTPLVTATRLWLSSLSGKAGHWDEHLSALCEHCGQGFEPPLVVLDAIRSISGHLAPEQIPCLELPPDAWREPRLLAECPHCHQYLKFNPFMVDPLAQDAHAISSLQRISTNQSDTVKSVSETAGSLTSQLNKADKARLDLINQINFYKQELIIHRNLGDLENEANTLEKIGDGYLILGEMVRAIEFFDQVVHVWRQLGHAGGVGKAINKIGDAYSQLGEPYRAIEIYEQALTIARDMGYREAEGVTQGKLGQAYMKSGEVFRALECFGEWIHISRTIGDRRSEGHAYFYTSLAFMDSPFRGQAIKHAETALHIFKESGTSEELNATRDLLSSLRTKPAKQREKKWWQFWK
jgi:WD40 repeat protein/tetratricopeptide (TPR) repeat protein